MGVQVPLLHVSIFEISCHEAWLRGVCTRRLVQYVLDSQAISAVVREEHDGKEWGVQFGFQICIKNYEVVEDPVTRTNNETVTSQRPPGKAQTRREICSIGGIGSARKSLCASNNELTIRLGRASESVRRKVRVTEFVVDLHRRRVVFVAQAEIDR